LSDALAGKSLKIVLDGGPAISYRFADRKRLSFAEGDAASVDTERDVIDIAPDRQTAMARLHFTAQLETVLGPSCPLVEMAKQQGGGVVQRTERAVFENAYVRRDGVWRIQRSICKGL